MIIDQKPRGLREWVKRVLFELRSAIYERRKKPDDGIRTIELTAEETDTCGTLFVRVIDE